MRFKQYSSNLEHHFNITGYIMIRRMKKNCFTLISLCILVLISVPAFSQPKLGYVKVDEVIRKANIAKNAEDKLKKEFAPRDNELKKMNLKLKNLANKFDKEQAVLTKSDKQKLQREIANIEKELQRKRRQAREDLTQRKNEELAAVVEKARAAIKEIAEDEKYDLILENSVYASPKVDITAKVIKALNEKK